MTMSELVGLVSVSGGILAFVVTIPTMLHYRHERWKTQWEHEKEKQLRAIELGTHMPGEGGRESWFSPIRVGMIIGAGVPVGAFLSAMVTTITTGFHDGVWVATCIVGLGAVLSGSMCAGHAYSASKAPLGETEEKPVVEEDAYDVVSARG
jgi:hypothetical protein